MQEVRVMGWLVHGDAIHQSHYARSIVERVMKQLGQRELEPLRRYTEPRLVYQPEQQNLH
jgi:hypothetical protein